MSSEKLVKKGTFTKDEEGNLLLVNEENQAYQVTESAAAVWERCDGKTVEELTADIAALAEKEPDDIKEPVIKLISSLKQAKLVE